MTTSLNLDEYKKILRDFGNMSALNAGRLIAEVERLKRGDFTEEEFQNLCHNFDEKDECKFKQGCLDYWKKLFGTKHGEELIAPPGMRFVAVKIPDGYELVDRVFRAPKLGETFINLYGDIVECKGIESNPQRFAGVIVRKKWIWPEWLTCDWIAQLPNGCWVSFEGKGKPTPSSTGWLNINFVLTCLQGATSIEFPPHTDNWRESLIRNTHKHSSETR